MEAQDEIRNYLWTYLGDWKVSPYTHHIPNTPPEFWHIWAADQSTLTPGCDPAQMRASVMGRVSINHPTLLLVHCDCQKLPQVLATTATHYGQLSSWKRAESLQSRIKNLTAIQSPTWEVSKTFPSWLGEDVPQSAHTCRTCFFSAICFYLFCRDTEMAVKFWTQ